MSNNPAWPRIASPPLRQGQVNQHTANLARKLEAPNCLFVDDNPIEREQVRLAFPDIRVLEGPIYNWRRTLLWAAELQVPLVTEESTARTESIQHMIRRDEAGRQMSEEEYFRELDVRVAFDSISDAGHGRFARAFELLNKTNQFNTTGRRWTAVEMEAYFAAGGHMIAATVSDRLSQYGLTAVLLYRGSECTQVVMSCRVFGLRVEFALFEEFARQTRGSLALLFRDTGKNPLCRQFLARVGIILPAEAVEEVTGFEPASTPSLIERVEAVIA